MYFLPVQLVNIDLLPNYQKNSKKKKKIVMSAKIMCECTGDGHMTHLQACVTFGVISMTFPFALLRNTPLTPIIQKHNGNSCLFKI